MGLDLQISKIWSMIPKWFSDLKLVQIEILAFTVDPQPEVSDPDPMDCDLDPKLYSFL